MSMAETEILELYELSYSDLLHISSDHQGKPPSSQMELKRLDLARGKVMEALGPTGPGLLSVSGVPNAVDLRRDLLLGRSLALLDSDSRKRVLKEQNLGTDVPLKNPERNLSSFVMQFKLSSIADVNKEVVEVVNDEYKNLGHNLKKLGFLMIEIGLRIARVCDAAIGGGQELEQSILESSAAKGRLIHYHSELDRRVLLKQGQRKKQMNWKCEHTKQSRCEKTVYDCCDSETRLDMWQQWHYDYGIFTILTAPLFLTQRVIEEGDRPLESRCKECAYPNGHTSLQIFDPRKKRIFNVKASQESFIIQVGESAEVISKGKLRATLHSVAKPMKLENLSRETFVVFLQPAWSKVLPTTYDTVKCLDSESKCVGVPSEEELSIERIQKIVPPLSLRLKDGITFAEFSRETTRQYFGGSGLQSNR